MITVEGKTTLVGIAELRNAMKDVLEEIKTNKVVLTRRNKPVGVILDYGEYKKMKELSEAFEDMALGQMAKERAQRKNKKVLSLEEAEKRLGLK